VHADQAKARKAIAVPLNSAAVFIVRKWLGKHPTHVFSYRGAICGIPGQLARANGTPLFAFQEMGGWSSVEMVRRYAHLAADHLAPFAECLCALRAVESEIPGAST